MACMGKPGVQKPQAPRLTNAMPSVRLSVSGRPSECVKQRRRRLPCSWGWSRRGTPCRSVPRQAPRPPDRRSSRPWPRRGGSHCGDRKGAETGWIAVIRRACPLSLNAIWHLSQGTRISGGNQLKKRSPSRAPPSKGFLTGGEETHREFSFYLWFTSGFVRTPQSETFKGGLRRRDSLFIVLSTFLSIQPRAVWPDHDSRGQAALADPGEGLSRVPSPFILPLQATRPRFSGRSRSRSAGLRLRAR